MRKTLTRLTVCFALVLVVSSLAMAQLEVVFPFMEMQMENFYIKTKTTDYSKEKDPFTTEVYKKDGLMVSITEFKDRQFLFGYKEDDWAPKMEDHLQLFYSNYELRIVQVETVAGREALVIELVEKKSQQLRHKYLVDQETGLTLSQYLYDKQGNLTTAHEVLEVDYDPDSSVLDFDQIHFLPSFQHHPLTVKEVKNLLPWINLESLSLLEPLEVVGYSKMDYPSEMSELSYFNRTYPNAPISNLWIWASDGYEVLIVEIAFISDVDIAVSEDSVLEIIERLPSSTKVAIVDQPVTISLHGDHHSAKETAAILRSLSAANQIINSEALEAEFLLDGQSILKPIDFSAVPQEPLSREEFFQLAPMAFSGPSAFPQGLEVVSYAKVHYPEALQKTLPIYEEYPDVAIKDFVIVLSDGERFHHVGLSFAPNYTDYVLRSWSRQQRDSWVIILFKDWPISFFSHSDFLSYEEQMDILRTLGRGYVH